jgi:hydrophobe/amphiphile efflux-1 (HAE1) family protein
MNKVHWSHVFIRYPVWAFVLSILILLMGARSYFNMQVRRFPDIQVGVININAGYPGASAYTMQSSVTTPLQRLIAQADGIDHLIATTKDGLTQIEAHLKIGYDPDKAFTDMLAKVQSAKRYLPADMDDPVIVKGTGRSIALMYVAYCTQSQGTIQPSEIYNYLDTVIRPQLLTVSGVGSINILGACPPAMRLWVDFDKMQQYQINFKMINDALGNQNFSIPAGTIKEGNVQQMLFLNTRGTDVEDFRKIAIHTINQQIITLGDIATIELGAENYDSIVTFNDKDGVFLSIDTLPTANALSVIDDVRHRLEQLEKTLPSQLQQKIIYDATDFINESILEVFKTIFEASAIVIIVMYGFLGSLHAVLIPLVTIPLSLIGVGSLMSLLGFSINLLTLLAMILAIGLVVDDAIIVVENCFKYLEKGLSPLRAAQEGIAEIAQPVIVMTLILAIAYLPIAFLEGLTGGLFKEFAFTLSSCVLISGVIALTLSPLMCALLLKEADVHKEPQWIKTLTTAYENRLGSFFLYKKSIIAFIITTLALVFLLGKALSQELAPKEDQGFALISYSGPQSASLEYTIDRSLDLRQQIKKFDEMQDYFLINGAGEVNTGFGGFIAKSWNKRSNSIDSLESDFRREFGKVIGLEVFSFTPNALPGPDGLPFQFVLFGPFDFNTLYQKANSITAQLRNTGYFAFLTTNLKMNKPVLNLSFETNRLQLNKLNTFNFASSIMSSLSEGPSSKFTYGNQELNVITQAYNRSLSEILYKMPIAAQTQYPVSLNEMTQTHLTIEPNMRYQFNQMNAVTIEGMLFPLFTIGDAISVIEKIKPTLNQEGFFTDYSGPTRSYLQEGNQLVKTSFFTIIIIYLVLCALFHSFSDPLIIMISVPLAISGALACMNASSFIGFFPSLRSYSVTLNIYTQLGLLTLMGLITKHGILIVEVANEYKSQGLSLQEAAFKAAIQRFRPIMMTTAAMIVGVLPLLFAQGPGAVSRYHLGFVISTGLGLGTFFTLFIIPIIYSMISTDKIVLFEKEF